jgi:lysyl-tRNA synthetase class 2
VPRINNSSDTSWLPTASLDTLKSRARLLQQTRSFFYERNVLEVETPILTSTGSTEIHLDQFTVSGAVDNSAYKLITSPELAMKRLLAAGSGDIFQLTKVFRAGEKGKQHQPEFTMLEWYRTQFGLKALMDEVEQLFIQLLNDKLTMDSVTITYAQAFEQYLAIDPFSATQEKLQKCFVDKTQTQPPVLEDKQDYLDLLMSHFIEPQFEPDRLTFVTRYPAEQASLARISVNDPRVAERFEVFAGGLELANGFYELTDVEQQRNRMFAENKQRIAANKPEITVDQKFLAALEAGLPDCSGVAVGFDRLVMIATGKKNIEEVICFSVDNN